MSLDLSKLVNVRPNSEGWDCMCPVCAQEGKGLRGKNQLRLYRNGAFHCVLNPDDRDHNRRLRAILRGYLDSSEREEVVYIEPKLDVETVYPESVLGKLLPDYSYWVGRGMKEDVLRRLENGVAPLEEKGKLSGRTVFPIRNLDGGIVGFSGRLLTDSSFAPKWKHLMKSSRCVYPWNVTGSDITATKTCILVESIGDLLGCLSHDIKPVLCIFGLNLNSVIISTLLAHDVRRVIISLNRDDDPRKGQAAADKIATKLGNFFSDVRIMLPQPPFKDWGECSEKGDDAAFDILRQSLT